MSIPRDNYIGEPQYPGTWTTGTPREGLRDIDEARIVSLAPDVCLTPVGSSVVPIPYPVVDFCGHDKNYTPSVRFTGKKAMVMRSCTTHVHGDAPGSRKGVKSGTVESICEPIGHADQVRAEGSHVIRHLDRFYMNSRNTQGEAIFVRGTQTYDPPKDDDPVRGSLRWQDDAPVQLAQAATGTMTDAGNNGWFSSNGNNTRALTGTATGTVNGGGAHAPSTSRPIPKTPSLPKVGGGKLLRKGIWAMVLEDMLRDLSMPEDERATEGRALGAIMSKPGQAVIVQDKLLGGRQPVTFGNILKRETWDFSGKYGIAIDPEERVPLANDILSSISGKPMDVRTMSDAEVNGLLAPFQGLSDEEIEQKLKDIREARQQEEQEKKEDPKPGPQPVPPPPLGPSTRIDGKKRRRKKCLIGPYDEIKEECSDAGDYAHHVVADMTYRLGDRPGKVTTERVPNAPTEGEGESICLTEAQHSRKNGSGGVHELTRNELKGIDHPDYPGTAPMEDILLASQDALLATKGIDKACAEAANARAEEQVKKKTGLSAPGRTKEKPLPTGKIADVLRAGKYP
ncbi:DUF4150 domain-containing protein [Agrobacterium radiobacter]|uniref:DUF4150 domain-containing protein n=1 Tax=Agrobacterium radiobacter TaxID=362 RepID=UPI003F85AA28